MARLEELAGEDWVNDDTVERTARCVRIPGTALRARSTGRRRRGRATLAELPAAAAELLVAERQSVVDLRRDGTIGDEVMRRVERDLDLEIARLDVSLFMPVRSVSRPLADGRP